jgi:hypothetical protein
MTIGINQPWLKPCVFCDIPCVPCGTKSSRNTKGTKKNSAQSSQSGYKRVVIWKNIMKLVLLNNEKKVKVCDATEASYLFKSLAHKKTSHIKYHFEFFPKIPFFCFDAFGCFVSR